MCLPARVPRCRRNLAITVVGQQWLGVDSATNTRRIDDVNDPVRIEIEFAVKHNIPIIPLLFDGMMMERLTNLPASIATFVYRNGFEVRADPYFRADLDMVVRRIRIDELGAGHQTSPQNDPPTRQVRVFVSHHHSAAEDVFTARLVADLKAAGADVWVDTGQISSGNFVRKINEGMAGRQWLVLVMTPESLKSRWVQEEVDAALHQVHGGRMLGVIPVVAQACSERDVPALWATLHRYDAVGDYQGAVAGLLHALGLGAPTR